MRERTQEQKLDLVDDILTRGVEHFIDPNDAFKQKLEGKINGTYEKPIVIKLGADPTRPDLHLGHAAILRKLRRLQDVGCKVLFLIGDFTSFIGDPTGKDKTRPEVTDEEIAANMQTYIEQVEKILIVDDPERFAWIRNSDWYLSPLDIKPPENAKLTVDFTRGGEKISVPLDPNTYLGRALFYESSRQQRSINPESLHALSVRSLLATLRTITLNQVLERDMFQKRLADGSELRLHELLYPIIQALDSVFIAKIFGTCDLEIGGTDQLFNIMMGRSVMKTHNVEEQAVMTLSLLPGTDGDLKMSKSQDNYIGITEAPEMMYGKVMSIPDQLLSKYFELAAITPLSEVQVIEAELKKESTNPRDVKMRLAREIVTLYHGAEAAEHAEAAFVGTFRDGAVPDNVPEIKTKVGERLDTLFVEHEIVSSKTEFSRLVKQGAVSEVESGEKVGDTTLSAESGTKTYRIGKHRFVRVVAD